MKWRGRERLINLKAEALPQFCEILCRQVAGGLSQIKLENMLVRSTLFRESS